MRTIRNYNKWICGTLGILSLILIWELTALYMKKIFPETAHTVLPTIEYVFRVSLPELSSFNQSGTGYGETSYLKAFLVLGKHSLITAARVIVGTSLGMLLGVFLGILMAWSPTVKKYLQPIVSFIRPIPLLALVPLFILWFGGKEAGNILYIVFG